VLAFAGCGGGDDGSKGPASDSDGRYTVQQVVDHFKDKTGQTLQPDAKEAPGWDLLHPVGGSYDIYVTHSEQATQMLVQGDPRARPEPPDARGVVWVRQCPPGETKSGCFWAGSRRFGKNVLLVTAGDRKTLPGGVRRAIDALEDLD
jgi:hypothetical protein